MIFKHCFCMHIHPSVSCDRDLEYDLLSMVSPGSISESKVSMFDVPFQCVATG